MYKEPEFIGILINRVVVIDLYPGGLYGVPTYGLSTFKQNTLINF
jgi:hypothetical protein